MTLAAFLMMNLQSIWKVAGGRKEVNLYIERLILARNSRNGVFQEFATFMLI